MVHFSRLRPRFNVLPVLAAIVLCLASGAPGPAHAAASAGAACHKRVRFLGFSANERAWVEEVALTCRDADGTRDELSFARVHATATGAVLATFRNQNPRRINARGTALAQSPAQWARRYTALAHTLSLGAWERFERNAHLRKLQHAFGDEVARLRADETDVVHVHVQGSRLKVTGSAERAWRADVIVSTMDGEDVPVATVIGQARECVALQLFYSGSGRHVAIFVEHASEPDEILVAFKPLPDPIDLPNLGVANYMAWENESLIESLSSVRAKKSAPDPELEQTIDNALAL